MIDRAIAIASRPDVDLLLLRRHAARARLARRPAEGEGARRRRADRLLAPRRAAPGAGRTRSARSSSSRSASRRPPPPTPWPCTARRRRGSRTSRSWWRTSWCRRPSRRCSSARTREIQGLLAPGHVCAVTGYRDYEPVAAKHRIPIVVTGFEPLDLLKGILAAVDAARAGRGAGREPVPARGRPRRQPGGPADDRGRVRGLRPELARARGDPEERLRPRARVRGASTPSRSSTWPGSRSRSPRSAGPASSSRVACGPTDCPEFGTRCTPEHPLGATMVSTEGACAAYFHYAPPRDGGGRAEPMARSLDAMLSCPAPLDHRDIVELAHGGGGTQDRAAHRDAVRPRLPQPAPRAARATGRSSAWASERLAFTTDTLRGEAGLLPRRRHRLAGRPRHRERPRHVRGRAALPERRATCSRRASRCADLERVVASMAEACRSVGVPLVTGDTKVVDRGKGDGIYVNTSGVGRVRDGVSVGPAGPRPGTR